MRAAGVMHRSLLAACLAVLTACSAIQAQDTDKYTPSVGQKGKDVVWVPTPQALVDKMLDMAGVTEKDYVIDLGSGDGRTVITAAKRGARALGIEYNPDMVTLSRRNAEREGVSERATFMQADLFESDLSQATVITMFLLSSINLKLRPIILDLKPGTRIVSNTFTMGDWEADETASVETSDSSWNTALFWIVPAKAGGTWKMTDGVLSITQEYQRFSGALTSGGQTTELSECNLRGDQISFSARGTHYTGRVNGDSMEGTSSSGGNNRTWRAVRTGK